MNLTSHKVYNFSTWLLVLCFLTFIIIIGFNVCLQTDDLVLLNLYKENSLLASYRTFPFNFRLGSYSIFYFVFKHIPPEQVNNWIGFFYLFILLFCTYCLQYVLKFYFSFFNSEKIVFKDRIKISLYILVFTFFYSETISETWFWTNAILTYLLPFYIALVLSTFYFREKLTLLQISLFVLGNLYIGGASESFALTWFVAQLIFIFNKIKLKRSWLMHTVITLLTLIPIVINYISTKIAYRIQFEAKQKSFHIENLIELKSFISHFDAMDVLALFALVLFTIELKLKKWHLKIKINSIKWLTLILISFGISLFLNLIVFKVVTPLRTFSVFNQVGGLFIIVYILSFSLDVLKQKVVQYSIPILILCSSVFYYYFYRQIKLTTEHKKAYTARIKSLQKNNSEHTLLKFKKLPNPGITVYADFDADPKAYSNQQFKQYYEIKGNFISE